MEVPQRGLDRLNSALDYLVLFLFICFSVLLLYSMAAKPRYETKGLAPQTKTCETEEWLSY